MRFNLKAALESLIGTSKEPKEIEGEGPVSIVMLLRKSEVTSLQDMRKAGEQAFGVPFSDDKNSQYFVVQSGLFTLIKAGIHALSWMHFSKPYFEDQSAEFGARMPKFSQREAWSQHVAWEAIDYVKSGSDPDLEYAVIARFCIPLLKENCAGIYLPKDQVFVPNDGSAWQALNALVAQAPGA